MNPAITLYSSRLCPVCRMMKEFLEISEIEHQEVYVDINPIARIRLIGRTGKLTVPQTNVNGKWISGFDPVKTLEILNDEQGKEDA